MGIKVQLPPGCSGFNCKDGTRYTADRPGGSVTMDDRHASALRKSQYQDNGFISGSGSQSFGTKKGQWCRSCNRIWNAWNHTCPKCGIETVGE